MQQIRARIQTLVGVTTHQLLALEPQLEYDYLPRHVIHAMLIARTCQEQLLIISRRLTQRPNRKVLIRILAKKKAWTDLLNSALQVMWVATPQAVAQA